MHGHTLRELRTEDLRVALGQNVGVRHLLPLALTVLEQDPFAEGMYYPGDLLSAVVGAEMPFLREQPSLAQRLTRILERALAALPDADVPGRLEGHLRAALERLSLTVRWEM